MGDEGMTLLTFKKRSCKVVPCGISHLHNVIPSFLSHQDEPFQSLYQTVTGKRPEQETDQSHLTKFLTSINNVEISREICR